MIHRAEQGGLCPPTGRHIVTVGSHEVRHITWMIEGYKNSNWAGDEHISRATRPLITDFSEALLIFDFQLFSGRMDMGSSVDQMVGKNTLTFLRIATGLYNAIGVDPQITFVENSLPFPRAQHVRRTV